VHVTEVIGQAGRISKLLKTGTLDRGPESKARTPTHRLQIQDLILEASEDLALPMFSIK